MTVRTTISLTDRHHQYAEGRAKEGQNGSVSSVVAAGLEALMQDERERETALQAMSDAIRDRMNTPREDWIDGVDDLFAKARTHLATK